MANDITPTGDSTNPLVIFLRKLHLIQIIGLIITGISFITTYMFAVYILKVAPNMDTQYVLIVALAMSGFVSITFLWVMSVMSGHYINGSATISGIALQGGMTPVKTPIASSGATTIYSNITNADLAALASLLQNSNAQLTPAQIQAIGAALSALAASKTA